MNIMTQLDLKKKSLLCSVCKKKEAKWVLGFSSPVLRVQFCSKTCIANHTIKHYKIKKLIRGENDENI
jgi:hypothetical protein